MRLKNACRRKAHEKSRNDHAMITMHHESATAEEADKKKLGQ
jgi:hypothetical protein